MFEELENQILSLIYHIISMMDYDMQLLIDSNMSV